MSAKRFFVFVSLSIFFCLLLSPVGAQQIILPFRVGETLLQNVNASEMTRSYQFNGLEQDSLFLLAVSRDYTNTPLITLTDNSTNRTVAMVQLGISGMCLRIAPGVENYTLSLTNANPPSTQYYGLLLLRNAPTVFTCDEQAMSGLVDALNGTAGGSAGLFEGVSLGDGGSDSNPVLNPPTVINPGVPGVPTGCEMMSASLTQGVNIRARTDVSAPIVGNLGVGSILPVLGIVETSDWLLANSGQANGFVARAAVEIGGDCSRIPVVTLDGSAVLGTGTVANLGVLLNLEIGTSLNPNASVDVNLGGENIIGVDAAVNLGGGNSGIGVDANVDVGAGGIGANVNVGSGETDIATVDINILNGGNEPIVDVQVPIIETGVEVGPRTCVNLLGIRILC